MTSPQLRFKEFDGEWNKIAVGDFSETVTSGSRDWAQYYSESGDKFIRMTNLVRDGINLDLSDLRFVKLPDNSNEGKRTNLQAGDILISITAELGKLGWIPHGLGTAYINQHTALVRMKNEMDSKFIAYELSTEKYNNKLNSLNDSGAKAGLNLSTIRNFELIVPSKPEQTKIASFLSTVDEKISQLTQKHQLLSQYKQGMMQKLFSQQIRFKANDGSEFGEWEKLTLSQISKHIGGTALESYVSECGDYNFISIGNYSTDGKYIDNSQRIILNEKTGTKLLDKDDLVMVLNDKTATGDLIGSTILINEDNKYIYNQRSERIICNKSKVLSVYLWHFLNSEMMRSEVRKLAQGGTQIYINFSSVLSIIFLLPCLAEQNKIADFLSSIDQKIEVVAQQIEQAKTWKKGLLQQMFV